MPKNKLCYFLNDTCKLQDITSLIKTSYSQIIKWIKKYKLFIFIFILGICLIYLTWGISFINYDDFQKRSIDFLAKLIDDFLIKGFFIVLYLFISTPYVWIPSLILIMIIVICKNKSSTQYEELWEKKGSAKKTQEFADNFRKNWWTVLVLGGILTILGITNFSKNHESQKSAQCLNKDINKTTGDVHKIESTLKQLTLYTSSLSTELRELKNEIKLNRTSKKDLEILLKKIQNDKKRAMIVKDQNVSQ